MNKYDEMTDKELIISREIEKLNPMELDQYLYEKGKEADA